MKNYLLIAFTSIMVGCGEVKDEIPLIEFSQEDYNYLPTVYEDIESITFKSQSGDEVILKKNLYQLSKEQGGGIPMGAGPLVDYQKFELKLGLPGDNCSLFYFFAIKHESEVRTWIDINESPCGDSTGYFSFNYDEPYPLTQLQIGNTTYDKVLIVENDYSEIESIEPYVIKRFYFDLKYGLLGFDDTANNITFRIEN